MTLVSRGTESLVGPTGDGREGVSSLRVVLRFGDGGSGLSVRVGD